MLETKARSQKNYDGLGQHTHTEQGLVPRCLVNVVGQIEKTRDPPQYRAWLTINCEFEDGVALRVTLARPCGVSSPLPARRLNKRTVFPPSSHNDAYIRLSFVCKTQDTEDIDLPQRNTSVNVTWSTPMKRWNEGGPGGGDPRENPPINGIVRHDFHMRKSGDPAWDVAFVGGERAKADITRYLLPYFFLVQASTIPDTGADVLVLSGRPSFASRPVPRGVGSREPVFHLAGAARRGLEADSQSVSRCRVCGRQGRTGRPPPCDGDRGVGSARRTPNLGNIHALPVGVNVRMNINNCRTTDAMYHAAPCPTYLDEEAGQSLELSPMSNGPQKNRPHKYIPGRSSSSN
ncbi:hypothetical protein PR048_019815 [Dryococelus australis]|uniref:Uncharacterized protein n=1 Tax=Dryococelus australis TaxID=614101 RepID=A0ABQ9H4J0_9NEOP|nr:hypothetical protein PR048_019815 [Dryococelus australis]